MRKPEFFRYVDTWKFAVAVAFIAMAFLTLWSLRLSGDVDRLLAQRLEEARHADEEQIRNCVSTAAQTPALQRLLEGIAGMADKLGEPQTMEDALNFARVSERAAPTLAECRTLARELGVNRVTIPARLPRQ